MATEQIRSRLSRRGLMKGATASAAALPLAGVTSLTRAADFNAAKPVLVTATVVRASHAEETGSLRIGVRASILAEDGALRHRVLVVEPVPFESAPEEMGRLIAAGVREQVARQISTGDRAFTPDEIAVQVFGGAL